jgi:Uma2 family endonuclease
VAARPQPWHDAAMAAGPHPYVSEAEYLAYDLAHEGRHEFYNGEIVAMAGATEAHALVTANLTRGLGNRLRGTQCRVYSADLRVHTEEDGAYVYPDVTVVCGPSVLLPTSPPTLVNPTLVCEVLSPSNAAHDRGAKSAHYRRMPSLAAYLLVDIDARRVEAYYRGEDGVWRLSEAQGAGRLEVPTMQLSLELAEAWEGLEQLAEASA